MRRLLLVEDDRLVARAIERAVRTLAHVAIAPTAQAGRKAFKSPAWTAVIIDVGLPDGNGLDVLARAREHGYTGPALIYSGHHDAKEINRAFSLDAQYLVKPVEAEELRAFVRKGLRRVPPVSVKRWSSRYNLTPAEAWILKAACDGQTRDEMAESRQTSELTTKRQINTLLAKTGDPSLLAAVARLLRER
jgi:DNA-binding NarL/FixJ family response regulator